jgi:two-component system nitrate/nitrite response regulator NarL
MLTTFNISALKRFYHLVLGTSKKLQNPNCNWVRLGEKRPMSKLLRVVVIDDHPLFRRGVVDLLTAAEGIEVVGQGGTGADALKVAQELLPDVMLLDVALPGGGLEAAARVSGACPNVQTVMLTASENEEHVAAALEAGARGYILKGSSGRELIEALRAIAEGQSYVPPNLGARLLIKKGQRTEVVAAGKLTSREEEILALVAQGMSNKEIARGMNCNERSVKHHMTSIMQKLDVRNRVQAALKFQPRPVADLSQGASLEPRI